MSQHSQPSQAPADGLGHKHAQQQAKLEGALRQAMADYQMLLKGEYVRTGAGFLLFSCPLGLPALKPSVRPFRPVTPTNGLWYPLRKHERKKFPTQCVPDEYSWSRGKCTHAAPTKMHLKACTRVGSGLRGVINHDVPPPPPSSLYRKCYVPFPVGIQAGFMLQTHTPAQVFQGKSEDVCPGSAPYLLICDMPFISLRWRCTSGAQAHNAPCFSG
eukprot:686290-Pelagomonas_calceolata.AAC.1